MKVDTTAERLLLRRANGVQEWPSEVSGGASASFGPTMRASRNWAEAVDARGRRILRGRIISGEFAPAAYAPPLRQVPVR